MPIYPSSPLGYALTIILLGAVIWWALFRENKFTRALNKQEYKKNWVYVGE